MECTSLLGVIFNIFSLYIENARPQIALLGETKHVAYIQTFFRGDLMTETTPLAWATGQNKAQVRQRVHLIKSALYAGQTFYAFMLM